MRSEFEYSQRKIGIILNRSTRQVRRLEAEGLPHRVDGRQKIYDIREVLPWWEERTRQEIFDSIETGDEAKAKLRKLLAEAELKELELAERRSQLLNVGDVDRLVSQPLQAVAATLRNAPSRHAADLAAEAGVKKSVAKAILKRIMDEAQSVIRGLTSGKRPRS